ncbi:helix-turn-helix transcriptional regulator [Flavivirga eckloniae]|uniref:HTH araC/xylS-type domain-containing protein n=1 Tax=Flavivirga eckloniae TaxID=1803846 RepID=A0A2K9PNC2_9FLAO|nr:AraC family transcriptional regulator [Flavivirga eckloniae]AUP78552.1 hypothetical protein C1H87_07435 [Flavivirga eckloniae]
MTEIAPTNFENIYYEHFSRKKSKTPPTYSNKKNYVTRFNCMLDHFQFNENSLTIAYIKQGKGNFLLEKKRLAINNNKVVVANHGLGWEYINAGNKKLDLLCFVISENFLNEFSFCCNTKTKSLLDPPLQKDLKDFLFIERSYNTDLYPTGKLLKSIYECTNMGGFNILDAKELTIEMLQSLYRDQYYAYLSASKIQLQKKTAKIETFKRLLLAYEYINDNYDKNISIDELSKVSSLSEFHLYNSFKLIFKRTPHQYILTLKMQMAKTYLREKKHTLTDIAIMLSFPNLSTFSKLFKKTYGISPSQYAL